MQLCFVLYESKFLVTNGKQIVNILINNTNTHTCVHTHMRTHTHTPDLFTLMIVETLPVTFSQQTELYKYFRRMGTFTFMII